ncbi:MAG: FecR domain-containing protein [Elusimicrobia bacterium]|nr:FecR domain-containing protein [Elusimicrobiota bacterium]
MTKILVLGILFAAAPAFAADAVLAKLSGPVFVRVQGAAKELPARAGRGIQYGDAVRTGPGAVAQLALSGRGAVLVRENSLFVLRGNPRATSLDFKTGEFLIGLRHALRAGESFQVRTPAAVAAVRGTLFWGKSDERKTTTYAGFGHTISVTARGKTVWVHAGQITSIPFGGAPAPVTPSAIPISYVDNFRVDGSLQNLEELVDLPKR